MEDFLGGGWWNIGVFFYICPPLISSKNNSIMMRVIWILAIVASVVSSVQARTISGIVISDKDSTAVAGATCRLMADKQFLLGTTTKQSGEFVMSTDVKVPLTLEIAMPGYEATEIIVDGGAKDVNLGMVYLSAVVKLDEVTVTAGRQLMSRGRTIVFPSSEDVKSSMTSISLFQKLPLDGLEADPINRTLSVDGGTPMILINGVPSKMDDLRALQPKNIAKVEYSRITPARYMDRGYSGFLNVVLKDREDGGQVYLWGRSAVATAFVDGLVSASYHQGASQFEFRYSPSWRNYQDVYDDKVESYVGDDFRVDLEEHDRNPFYYHMHDVSVAYNYVPNEHTLVSATLSAMPGKDKRRMLGHTMDSELGEYDNQNMSKSSDYDPSLDLFLHRDFNEKNSLEAQVVGTFSSSDYRRVNKYFFGNGATEEYAMDVDSRRRSLISEVSYTHRFSQNTALSGGYQNTLSHSENTYLTTDYKPVLTENNNYVYARLGQQVGKVYLSLSTGLKMFWIENDLNKRHFVKNLSSAQASWSMSDKWNMSASFQYSPSIPSLTSLTDYAQQVSPYLISNGNPNLKVSDIYTFRVMPSYRYKKFSAQMSADYRTISDFVMSDVTYMGNKEFLSQSVNARRAWNTGASLSMSLSDINGFSARVNAGIRHTEMSGDEWSNQLTSFSASMAMWWSKGPYTVSYSRKFPGKSLNGHVVRREENMDALEVEYKPNGHWSLSAGWMYMFERKGTKYPSWSNSKVNPSSTERYIKNNANMVVLSVSYSADFGSLFRSGKRSLYNSDGGSSLLKM